MMCAYILRRPRKAGDAPRKGFFARLSGTSERVFERAHAFYARSLAGALRRAPLVLAILIATLCLNIFLYIVVPKGFFPQQDTGRLTGSIQADQSISFQLMREKLIQFVGIVRKDPAIRCV